jgi:uncharacterized protein (DUF433 family)
MLGVSAPHAVRLKESCENAFSVTTARLQVMTRPTWRDRIVSDPMVCHGRARIRGTRLPVSVVLDNLAAGQAPEAVVSSYPSLSLDDIHAAMQYAAELARERLIPLEDMGT